MQLLPTAFTWLTEAESREMRTKSNKNAVWCGKELEPVKGAGRIDKDGVIVKELSITREASDSARGQ